MNDLPVCTKCKTAMTKTKTLDSGNSKYITYKCGSCQAEKTVCVGVGK